MNLRSEFIAWAEAEIYYGGQPRAIRAVTAPTEALAR
jgi:hypothetical protein